MKRKAAAPAKQGPKKRLRQVLHLSLATEDKVKIYRAHAAARGLSLGMWLEMAADAFIASQR